MKTCTITLAVALATIAIAPQSNAQRYETRRPSYDEPSKFPILRKAFRQIRSDLRYHAGAIRDTASDIRHDVSSTIRGDQPETYGYRGDQREYLEHHPEPTPSYGEYYYDERPQTRPQPSPRPQIKRQPEPKIVAPKPQAKPKPKPKPAPQKKTERPVKQTPKPKLEKKPTPTPAPKIKKKESAPPTPAPTPPTPKTEEKKPIIGKVAYPEAKKSNRAGYHFSPFAPYELLDTQGIEPGALAKDPGNGKIFRLPK